MPATCKNPAWTTLVMVLLQAGSSATAATIDRPRPNVVFILADDLGWADLGCYGSRF